jgi:hypothetical protein
MPVMIGRGARGEGTASLWSVACRVDLVHLVCFVHLVDLVQANKRDKLNKPEQPAGSHVSRIPFDGYGSVPSNSGETVRFQQRDGPPIDSEQPLIPKHTEQADGGFNRDPGHLSHFFPFESEPNLDSIGAFFAESVAEFQEQAGQPLAGSLERELVELIHIHPKLITEELDQLDRQLGIPVDDREVARLVDDADFRGLQRLARYLVKRPLAECMFLDQHTRAQDPDDLPLASCRRTSQLDLARTQQIEAQTQVAFVENGLVRLVIEGVFDFLKFGEVVSFEVAQHRLRAKRAGVAIPDETGLPFHDLPIIVAARHRAIEQCLEASRLYIQHSTFAPHGILRFGHHSTSAYIAIAFNRLQ